MESHSRIFYRLLLVATAINVLGLPYAVVQSQPWHAGLHAGLALGCGFWAFMLRHRRAAARSQAEPDFNPADSESGPAELGAGDQAAMRDEWLRRTSAREQQERREEGRD